MDLTAKWKQIWLEEEAAAHIHGWDFSHIHGRYEEEEDLPWDYETEIRRYLTADMALLDMDTGGGEFLLSLGHPFEKLSATEGYPPNVSLCLQKLLPLGIDFREADGNGKLPFPDGSFDMILNRHGSYQVSELHRLLKPGGLFVTQQVGEYNDRELVDLLLPGTERSFPGWNLKNNLDTFRQNGFEILKEEEAFRPIVFYDVGALVWFARIIEWEFPGFSVEGCWEQLLKAQELLERYGKLAGRIHRFLIVARKA